MDVERSFFSALTKMKEGFNLEFEDGFGKKIDLETSLEKIEEVHQMIEKKKNESPFLYETTNYEAELKRLLAEIEKLHHAVESGKAVKRQNAHLI